MSDEDKDKGGKGGPGTTEATDDNDPATSEAIRPEASLPIPEIITRTLMGRM